MTLIVSHLVHVYQSYPVGNVSFKLFHNIVIVRSQFRRCCFSVRRGDVLSAWSGIRPLVSDPAKGDTQSIARNHIIEVAEDNLITIAGNIKSDKTVLSLQVFKSN